jgi:hypothetical protein
MNKKQDYPNKRALRQRRWNELHPRKNAEYAREWKRRHAHPCVDCGISVVTPTALRCKKCASYLINHPKKKYSACIICGKPTSRGRSLRCRLCAGKARRRTQRMDGKRQNKGGYILVAFNGVQMLEHRMVWEQAHGKLSQGWMVHHLNGKRDDNCLKNLIALPQGKHHYALLIQEQQKRIQELEALLNGQIQLI